MFTSWNLEVLIFLLVCVFFLSFFCGFFKIFFVSQVVSPIIAYYRFTDEFEMDISTRASVGRGTR